MDGNDSTTSPPAAALRKFSTQCQVHVLTPALRSNSGVASIPMRMVGNQGLAPAVQQRQNLVPRGPHLDL
jgi:hypothetical protein